MDIAAFFDFMPIGAIGAAVITGIVWYFTRDTNKYRVVDDEAESARVHLDGPIKRDFKDSAEVAA